MRMTASWSGPNDPTEYKSVARRCRPIASSPRILNRPTDRHRPETDARQKARLAVHHRSACSGVKALRNTSDARRQAAKLCYRFGPLTPSARSGNLIAGDGTKNGLSRSEQRTGRETQKNNRLTVLPHVKFAARRCAPMASSPRIITQTGGVRRRSFEERLISLFILPPRAQGSRRCETQATLRRHAAKLR